MIGLFKTEVIHRREPWRSFDSVEYATLEWVEPLGYPPPFELEQRYHQQQGPAHGDHVLRVIP